ncbi:Uncharacterised protein [Mycobacteroides abscessus subsp. abscessus]|nr:Uncharacterised protein [Mycobacteroides abscessus subsp. abscessus]
MSRDVAARVGGGVLLVGGMSGEDECAQGLQRLRDEPGDSFGEGGEDANEVVGGPVARHEGFAESDQTAGADAT